MYLSPQLHSACSQSSTDERKAKTGTGKEHSGFHENYYCNPEMFDIKCKVFVDLMKSLALPHVGVKIPKIEDVKSLYQSLSPDGQQFFENIFKLVEINKSTDGNNN